MGKTSNPVAEFNNLLYAVISSAVATWAISDLALAWILALPQTPGISDETHLYINVGLFLFFAVVIWWKIDFQQYGIPTIGQILRR